MALNSPADLFLYELSGIRDAERTETLREQQQKSAQKVNDIEACFRVLGTSPQEVPCAPVDGMRTEFETFLNQQPAPEVLELYTLGTAMKLASFGVAGYKELVDKSVLMGETQCAQILQTNLVQKEEDAGRLERISHDMSQRVLATS